MLFRAKKYCEKACNQALTLSVLSCLLSAAALFVSLRGPSGTPAVSPTTLIAAEQTRVGADQRLENPGPAAQPTSRPAAADTGRKAGKGTCTAAARGLSSFACPGTPTEDVCGDPPYLTCFSGPNETCPPGKVWDPACSCTCVEK